jgi:Peptidase family M23
MGVGRSSLAGLVLLGSIAVAEHACFGAGEVTMTPLLLAVHDAPVPFTASDGRVHLVYELSLTNFSSGDIALEKVEALGDGVVLETLGASDVASRLQLGGSRESVGTMAKGTQGLLFLDVALNAGAAIPKQLSHRISLKASAAPPSQQEMNESGGPIEVDRQAVVVIGPPLRGNQYISADSCCTSSRHRRAALPVNGRLWLAQRFAVDWEQLDASGRIYSGPSGDVKSYAIFGKPVLAVADAVVSSTTDGLQEQTPGQYPTNISLDDADGNSVVLDLGKNRYALYAHMQPGSIKVHRGDRVTRGQVIGLVGNTGNSVAPHLHFQVMAGPLSLGSNGLPYQIASFEVTGKTAGTEAFDEAEAKGVPPVISAVSPPLVVKDGFPLDQLVISFGGAQP